MTNNDQLRELIKQAGLTQPQALALFNKGQAKEYSLSAWKSYLSSPLSARWLPFPDALLKHAIKRLEKHKKPL